MPSLQRINPCLWFNDQAEEAARFYTGIFPNSSVDLITHYSDVGQEQHQRPPGSVMTVSFTLDGQPMLGLNGGPLFKFSPAVSLMVNCDTQAEIDHYWARLGEGGDPAAQQCGWLADRYGVSWQITPRVLTEAFRDPDRAAAKRAFEAMMTMRKIDVAAIEAARRG